jgi:hypothetical protein
LDKRKAQKDGDSLILAGRAINPGIFEEANTKGIYLIRLLSFLVYILILNISFGIFIIQLLTNMDNNSIK